MSRGRLLGIEGLRGVAALLVLFRHVGQHTTDQDLTGVVGRFSVLAEHGLTLFFVLSGFLLFRPFAAAVLDGDPLPSMREYARNRALRIVPAYLVIFVLVALVFGMAYTEGAPGLAGYDTIGRLTDPTAIALNLLLLQTYVPGYIITGIGPAWSLTTEVAFYLALPFLALLSYRLGARMSRRAAVMVPPALFIGVGTVVTVAVAFMKRGMSTAQSVQFSWGQTWTAVLDRSLLSHADLFGWGMAAAVLVELLRRGEFRGITAATRAVLLVAAAVLLLPVAAASPVGGLTVGVAASLALIAVVLPAGGGQTSVLARRLEWAPMRYAGLVSYSFYLWHLPVIFWLREHDATAGQDTRGLVVTTLVAVAITLALSSATYWLVERPALNAKRRTLQPPVTSSAAAPR